MKKPLIILAAGGTGGHMFPAQALAEQMLSRGWRVKLSTDLRGARYTDGFPDDVKIQIIKSSIFSQGGLFSKFVALIQIIFGTFNAYINMRRDRPAVVIGFGGYAAVPVLFAAGLAKVPRVIHEQNGVLGRVNRFFCTRVQAVACGIYPIALPDNTDCYYTGNPVRAEILQRAATPYIPPGDWPLNVLVIGGSQGSQIVAKTAAAAIEHIPTDLRQHLVITCQARKEDAPTVKAKFDNHGIHNVVASFFDDIPARLSEAQLVISRAGASSVADISIIGRPSILIPFGAASDNHQSFNARELKEGGAAILISEGALTPPLLADCIIKVLTNPKGASQMAAHALSKGKPTAASDLADLVEAIANRGK